MFSKNRLALLTILVVFIIAMLILLPVDKGIIGGKGIMLGLDLQGGIHIVYQADLSGVEEGTEGEIMDGVIAVIANRIDPLGVTEPTIAKQGR